MKTPTFLACLMAMMFVLLPFSGIAGAQGSDGVPPFVQGEIAVYASPNQLPGFVIAKFLPNAGISVVKTQSGREWGLVQRFREKGFRAGLNLKAHAFVNDPYYGYQWHFLNVQAEEAWEMAATGEGVTVAVLDTGLALGGDDGIGCIEIEKAYDVVNGDNDPEDGDGHGTHVSGTVAQATGNGTGVAGLAFGACVLPVKVLDDTGSGTFADIAEGIYYAVNNGADVINMSLGTNSRFGITSDPVMDPALNYAYGKNVTVVCASGNEGNKKNVSYPAIYPTTIAVGATDYADQVTKYSNKGKGLDLVAPGGDLSKDLNGDGYGDGVLQETRIGGEWGYYFFQGTSMASPHVAAIAALLIAHGGVDMTPDRVYEALTSTALDLGDPGYDSSSGYGLVQAFGALNYQVPCTDADEDGWCVENDCNDNNATIHPGATEVCDGLDNNCDGNVDEDCVVGGCTDADGDGWCVEDGDCDDNDPTVYPGHPDNGRPWGKNGVDNDCDGIIDK